MLYLSVCYILIVVSNPKPVLIIVIRYLESAIILRTALLVNHVYIKHYFHGHYAFFLFCSEDNFFCVV